MNDVEDLYERLLDRHGEPAQVDVAIEEMAELTTALMHRRRGRASADEVIDEIADVMIVVTQLRKIYGSDEVDERVRDKLMRVKVRLNQQNGSKE